MKIALFAAVPDEVGALAEQVNFTGIGRENATRAMIRFMTAHADEDFVILNIGTVGSHDRPVGTILSIQEVISAGASFYSEKMLLGKFDTLADKEANVQPAILYSSDAFVSPEVFTNTYLDSVKSKADCFDMESSVLVSFAQEYGKKYVSYKMVSDNLDVDIEEWRRRVKSLSIQLTNHIDLVLKEIDKNEGIEFLK